VRVRSIYFPFTSAATSLVYTLSLHDALPISGVTRAFDGPVFNEFTLEFPRSVRMINGELLRQKFAGPLPLGTAYPELTKHGLVRSEEHTSELQSLAYLVCRLLLEKKKSRNTS